MNTTMRNFLMLVLVLVATVSCANNNGKKKVNDNSVQQEQEPSKFSDKLTGYYSLEKGGAPLYKIDVREVLDNGMIIYTCTTYVNGEPAKKEEWIRDIYDKIKLWPDFLDRYEEEYGLGFDKWLKHSLTVGQATFLIQTDKGYNYKKDFSKYRKIGVPVPDKDIDIISKTGYLLIDYDRNVHHLYKVGDIEEKEIKD